MKVFTGKGGKSWKQVHSAVRAPKDPLPYTFGDLRTLVGEGVSGILLEAHGVLFGQHRLHEILVWLKVELQCEALQQRHFTQVYVNFLSTYCILKAFFIPTPVQRWHSQAAFVNTPTPATSRFSLHHKSAAGVPTPIKVYWQFIFLSKVSKHKVTQLIDWWQPKAVPCA